MNWNLIFQKIARTNYKELTHAEIAERINRNPKTVSEWLRHNGYLKCPNYNEMEILLLSNYPVRYCAPFISHKSLNALKIKQWRLKRATLANASMPQELTGKSMEMLKEYVESLANWEEV